MAGVKARR